MKIAFLEPHLGCVGGIRRIIETSNWLVKFGHDVKIFTPKGRPCNWLSCNAPIIGLDCLQAHVFDFAVFNLAENFKWCLSAKADKRVFWVLAPEAEYKNPVIPLNALNQKFLLLANSNYTTQYIKKHVDVPYEIPIINGGINPNHFKYAALTHAHHVLYTGSPRPWKGKKLIEEALSGTGLKLRVLEGNVENQHKMYAVYGGADVFVSANLAEGFSMTQLEAMACGTPVVTTDDGGSRDYIINGTNAVVVKREIKAIRDAVINLLHDKVMLRNLRTSGLKTVQNQKFTWEYSARTFEKALLSF